MHSQGTTGEKTTLEILQKEEECHGAAWRVRTCSINMNTSTTAAAERRNGQQLGDGSESRRQQPMGIQPECGMHLDWSPGG